MAFEFVDEVIDGTPRYNVTDNDDGTKNIELANTVITEGTPLNKATFDAYDSFKVGDIKSTVADLSDDEDYLLCDGSTVLAQDYPELAPFLEGDLYSSSINVTRTPTLPSGAILKYQTYTNGEYLQVFISSPQAHTGNWHVYKSDDRKQWYGLSLPSNLTEKNAFISSIAKNTNGIYCMVGGSNPDSGYSYGSIWVTKDDGTWNAPIKNVEESWNTVASRNAEFVIGNEDGFARYSVDNGVTWNTLTTTYFGRNESIRQISNYGGSAGGYLIGGEDNVVFIQYINNTPTNCLNITGFAVAVFYNPIDDMCIVGTDGGNYDPGNIYIGTSPTNMSLKPFPIPGNPNEYKVESVSAGDGYYFVKVEGSNNIYRSRTGDIWETCGTGSFITRGETGFLVSKSGSETNYTNWDVKLTLPNFEEESTTVSKEKYYVRSK